jgi:hypothetical protein
MVGLTLEMTMAELIQMWESDYLFRVGTPYLLIVVEGIKQRYPRYFQADIYVINWQGSDKTDQLAHQRMRLNVPDENALEDLRIVKPNFEVNEQTTMDQAFAVGKNKIRSLLDAAIIKANDEFTPRKFDLRNSEWKDALIALRLHGLPKTDFERIFSTTNNAKLKQALRAILLLDPIELPISDSSK